MRKYMLLLNSFQIKTGVFQYAKLLFVKTGCVFRFLNVICWDYHSYKKFQILWSNGCLLLLCQGLSGAETLARTSVCPTPATNFQNNLVASDWEVGDKERHP